MVLKQVAAVAVAAISMLAQRESEGSETQQFSLRWVCRLVPIFVVIPVFRLVINVFVRLIRRCRRVPFLGLICWITGIQFVITVTWVMIRVVLVYWRWVCRWEPTPPQRGGGVGQAQGEGQEQ